MSCSTVGGGQPRSPGGAGGLDDVLGIVEATKDEAISREKEAESETRAITWFEESVS